MKTRIDTNLIDRYSTRASSGAPLVASVDTLTIAAGMPTRQAYSELQSAYDHFNATLFDGALPACLITLQREKLCYGYFSSKRFGNLLGQVADEIALNPSFFAVVSLREVMQTLVHEMAHLWQTHFGRPGRGRYHNEEWASKMQSIGLMPSSTGKPGGKRTGDRVADYLIDGGAFEVALAALLTQDFKVSWFDRFPASEALALAPVAAGISGQVEVVALDPETMANVAPYQASEAVRKIVVPTAPRLGAVNRSNRVKYQCQCSAVWGKPNLRIHCQRCGTEFTVLETSVDDSVSKMRLNMRLR